MEPNYIGRATRECKVRYARLHALPYLTLRAWGRDTPKKVNQRLNLFRHGKMSTLANELVKDSHEQAAKRASHSGGPSSAQERKVKAARREKGSLIGYDVQFAIGRTEQFHCHNVLGNGERGLFPFAHSWQNVPHGCSIVPKEAGHANKSNSKGFESDGSASHQPLEQVTHSLRFNHFHPFQLTMTAWMRRAAEQWRQCSTGLALEQWMKRSRAPTPAAAEPLAPDST